MYKNYWYLIAIVLLGFVLRFHKIGEFGIAGDEKYSLFVSQQTAYEGNNQRNSVRNIDSQYFTPKEFWSPKGWAGFNDAIARVDTGNGAFYTFLLHYWTLFFGLNDSTLRMLGLLFNLATIVLVFQFVKTHFKNEKLALIAAFFASISPFFINFSQVARNYAALYFFSLLASHLILLILEKFKNKQPIILLSITYGFTILACELCHISAFPLFFIHGFFVLLVARNFKLISILASVMLIPALGVGLWLNSDGGKWMFDYVSNSVKTYNLMANSNPDEYLSVASFRNIFKQMIHVLSSLNFYFEGLYLKLIGLKNIGVTISISLLNYFLFSKFKTSRFRTAFFFISTLAIYFLTSINSEFFIVFFVGIQLILFAFYRGQVQTEKLHLVLFLILNLVAPFLFLVIFSKMDGNTFRIIPRYVGYAYATNLIFWSWVIHEFITAKDFHFVLKCCFLSVLLLNIFYVNKNIYEDNPPRYFMSFAEPRTKNPHQILAEKIKAQYVKGDTVVYCSFNQSSTPGGKDLFSYSVIDAQLTNFYLPKNADFIQRIDRVEPNKVLLKKANGTQIELFNFEGVKFRY